MVRQNRQGNGKFAQKSEEYRHVRSIRLTDKTWDALGKLTEERGITRADLIEEWVSNRVAQLEESVEVACHSEVEALRSRVAALQEENSLLFEEQITELENTRDRLLTHVLKLGKQSARYKDARKALDFFINEIKSLKP